ncbi:hypothetical protein HanRHA438_Chr11g0507081 [Helianthus annuus]|nr:hypothetical protein HanRHA438_Chr11g0507081 [Helianthus annuus]
MKLKEPCLSYFMSEKMCLYVGLSVDIMLISKNNLKYKIKCSLFPQKEYIIFHIHLIEYANKISSM